jgi:SAM-dependent methyltransferase
MRRQGEAIVGLLPPPEQAGIILDVACGIGTQSLAPAALGYAVEGSDVSAAEIARAKREAAARALTCAFRVDDMQTLRSACIGGYGAVMAMDNDCRTSTAMQPFWRPSQRCGCGFDRAADF